MRRDKRRKLPRAAQSVPVPTGDLGGDSPGSVCATHDVPIANLTDDYPYSQTPPAFTFIGPNDLNDGHSSSAKYGDAWLSGFVPKLMAKSWFSSSVIFITYDESYGANPDSGYDGLAGGPVYMVAVSPFSAGTGALGYNASHYDTLATIEWLLGLPRTGTGNDSTAEFPAMESLFQFPVSGTVSSAVGGAPIVGANVSVEGQQKYNLTDSAGGYTIRLPVGNYTLNATAIGYLPNSESVTVSGSGGVQNFSLAMRPVTRYAMSGGVYAFATRLPISGANVTVTPGPTEETGADGLYSFSLVNGSYDLSVSAVGFNSTTFGTVVAGMAVDHTFWLNNSSFSPPPILTVIASVATDPIVAGDLVGFSVNVTGGVPPYTEKWTFDDGGLGSGATPMHSFVTAGNYTVNVQVNDSRGNEANGSVHVEVLPADCGCSPVASPPWILWFAGVVAIAAAVSLVLYVRRRRNRPPEGVPRRRTT